MPRKTNCREQRTACTTIHTHLHNLKAKGKQAKNLVLDAIRKQSPSTVLVKVKK